MRKETFRMINRLEQAGISESDAWALRRIAMTLHRWGELECGTDRGCIERDEKTGKPFFYNARARFVDPTDPRARVRIRDMEAGALKRLDKIMNTYETRGLSYYHQTDPRGASLYILRPGDVPADADVSSYYTRGIAVYQ